MVVYALARFWSEDRRVAVLAATALITSRAFLFPATMARPDMATAMFGLVAVWSVVRYRRDPRDRRLLAAGVAAGCAMLCHPYGVVPATQCGLALLAERLGVARRLRGAAVYSGVALAVFGLWLPLIALHPDLFRVQFDANVLSRAGTGLGKTLAAPVPILGYQASHFREFVQPLQGLVYLAALAWTLVRSVRLPAARELLGHCAAAALLLAVLQGRHTAIGYYVFPVALFSLAVGLAAVDLADGIARLLGSTRG